MRRARSRGHLAVLLLSAAAVATAARRGAAQTPGAPEVVEAARALFREGAQLASDGRWAEARERFERALSVRPTPLTRFNLALAAQHTGQLVQALDQYRQFLRDDSDPANAARRREAQQAIDALEPRIPRVVLSVAPAGAAREVRLDGHAVPVALLDAEIPVDPGEAHVVEVTGRDAATARQVVTLPEGGRQRVVLTLRAAPAAPTRRPGADATTSASPGPLDSARAQPPRRRPPAAASLRPPPGRRDGAAAPSTNPITRMRLSAEARSHSPDHAGFRRWERTVVLGVFQGTGHALGILGVTARWAARPWFDIELQSGVLGDFGPGVGFAFSLRYPWSYRYSLGLLLAVSTNFTRLRDQTHDCPTGCGFNPIWLSPAVAHEWRTAVGFTYRLSLGAKFLVNNYNLRREYLRHTTRDGQANRLDETLDLHELLYGNVSFNYAAVPVLPFILFDIGWSL